MLHTYGYVMSARIPMSVWCGSLERRCVFGYLPYVTCPEGRTVFDGPAWACDEGAMRD